MITRVLKLLLVLMIMTVGPYAYADDQSDKVKAIFLFKFMDYIQWDNITISTPVICTYPNPVFGNLLHEINQIKKNQYVIRNPVAKGNIGQCHILYIGKDHMHKIVMNDPVLTISDGQGFAQNGGMIELRETPQKIKLIVNIPQLKIMGLTPSSRLLDVAEIIR